ncbi:hypothetical protein H8E88_05995 [candidate division KSB1 bacterium]|nr:hypothetical protein [candidate division KSB1 bacterium]
MDKDYEFDVVVMVKARFREQPKDHGEEWKRQLTQVKLDVYAQKTALSLKKMLEKNVVVSEY